MRTLFNDGWKFFKFTTPECDETPDYKPVQIPHDWLIHDAENLYETSYGSYIKTYDFGNVAGKSIRLYFEGVYMNCTVYVNGQPAADWKYGYTSFEADLTDLLHDGENTISVLVRHESPNTRWYSGAGIFRDVHLIVSPTSHIVTDSVYFHTEKQGNDWHCVVSSETANAGGLTRRITLAAPDKVLYQGELPASDTAKFTLTDITEKYIWDIASPNLLALTVELIRDGEVIDESVCKVGLRDIEYKPDSGFFLNGRHIKLNGVCLHHDLGCLGAAFNKAAAKRQLQKMMEMGANAVRTSHNPPAIGFMELCDELGILVDSEAFDMWERPKTEYDYARFFGDWYKKDVASWVRRDRNHPSVIMWSVGNEIYDTHVSPRGCEVAKMLHDAVRENDPLCNAPTTIGSNYMPWEGAQNCAMQVDLVGYNYGESLYEQHHAEHPEWKIYGSETTSGVKSRGVYHFPAAACFMTHADLQCSSLGNCKAGAGAITAQKVIEMNRDIDVCAGMFIWTGADYIGEPSPYSTKNAYFGNIDTAGLEKDSFYLYQAAWTDKPVLHLMPYWDFNDGQLIDVITYTNLREVELFVNGKSVGKQAVSSYTAAWQIPYEKGEIKAVGVTADGKEISDIKRSFGDSAKIVLSSNRSTVIADGEDIAVIVIGTVDKDGNPVENARDRVTVTVDGGRLVGYDNGDSTDYDSYKSASRRLFSGKAAAYIAPSDKAGTITVTATAEGLESASIVINAVSGEVREGISMLESITDNPYTAEIPLRKIELTRSGGSQLDPEHPDCEITARLLPENASYTDLSWSIVTNSGIVTNLGEVTADGNKAVVKGLGDGSFRLRCQSLNGRKQPEIISELEFTASGFGQPTANPYEFLSGCLYSYSLKLMDEVQRGGVNIKKDNNIVGFTKTDFGKYGSEEFTVSIINWHSDAPFNFRLWIGKPFEDGSKCLGDFTYQANFIWQTYIENSYRLPERITGVQDIYFEFDKNDLRVDFGGFYFTPILKAYEVIPACDYDMLHGDTFEEVGSSVNKIGNNVFMDFDGMDFAKGTSEIIITGKTRHDNDSIHVHFEIDGVLAAQEIVEFPYSEQSISVAHPLPDIRGKGTVQFKFLPGCDFDFDSFEIKPKNN
ncbi:MAG: DUF4982 domain-containing protein [Eubacterium sp.]|nr:DUF4982 domain-containing protein [Eubacterium sp.]